ncbi:hypothetical protein ACF0H5_001533 [Mactra antiquata]
MLISVSCYMRVCYYTNWSQYRPNGGKFTPEKIDPKLCSHIIYAFGKLEGNALVPFEWNDDSTEWSTGMYAKVNNLKVQSPGLKTLLATGGWNAGSLPFSDMVATKASRKQFINSTLHYLRQRNFDGLDMDWEYPAKRGGRPEDKANLVLLLSELMQAFEHESYHTGQPRLLLTAAVPAGKSNIDAGYDIPNIVRNLDFINIMTYDLHGSWEPVTGHNSPLFGRTGETAEDAMLNMEWAVDYWTKKGAPKHKLVVGLGLYGRSFQLTSPASNGLGAPATGAGQAGKYTREPGFLAYYEVCEELKKGATRVWQAEHRAPYLYNNDLWVGYDDEESVKAKVRWMKQKGYGGVMIWSLALDDFSGTFCNKGPYPLLTAINVELGHIGSNTQTPMTVQKRSGVVSGTPVNDIASNINNGMDLMGALAHIMTPPPTQTVASSAPTKPPPSPNQSLQVSSVDPPPTMMASNSGNMAAAAAIGELLLQGTANLTPPRPPSQATHINQPSLSQSPSVFDPNLNAPPPPFTLPSNTIGHSEPHIIAPPPPLTQPSNMIGHSNLHHAAPPPIFSGPITSEFVHNSHGVDTGTHTPPGTVGDVAAVSAGHGTFPTGHHSVGHVDILPSTIGTSVSGHSAGGSIGHIDIQPLPPSSHAQPTPPITIQGPPVMQPAPAVVVPAPVGMVDTPPVVVGPLPVVGTVAVPDIPVAAAAHSDIGLKSVRPAPPSKPNVNFSFSSSKSSNSSSSSSSSSSSKSESTNINLGGGTVVRSSTSNNAGQGSPHGHGLSLQDLLQQGPVDIHPVAVNTNDVSSVVDQNQGIVPGGTVKAVIPIDNIDSLAQVLASLETTIPTSNSVLLPEPRNDISPNTVLRELDISNILGANIATPVQVTLAPSRREPARRTLTSRGSGTGRVDPRRVALNRQNIERLRQEQERRRGLGSSTARTSQSSRNSSRSRSPAAFRSQRPGNFVTAAQIRGLVSILGTTTVRDLLRSGRIRVSPSVQRRQVVRRPVTRTRIPTARDGLVRRQRISPSDRRVTTVPSLTRSRLGDRRVTRSPFIGGGGGSRLTSFGSRRSLSPFRSFSRDPFSSFGFL